MTFFSFLKVSSISVLRTTSRGSQESLVRASNLDMKRKKSWMGIFPHYHHLNVEKQRRISEDVLNPWEAEDDRDMKTLSFVAHSVSGGAIKKTNLNRELILLRESLFELRFLAFE